MDSELRNILRKHGVNADEEGTSFGFVSYILISANVSTVPVYDLTDYYGSSATSTFDHSEEAFLLHLAHAPRWKGEIPSKSFVGIQGLPTTTSHNGHVDLRFTLCRVFVIATAFGQKSGCMLSV
jgi:hypothetical protein